MKIRLVGLFALVLCLLFATVACAEEAAGGDAIAISLTGDSAECDSASVSVDGATVTIAFPGEYILSGKLTDGQIVVDSAVEGKITLILDNVEIHNEDGPAIYIGKVSPRVSIRTTEGSVNTLSAGAAFVLTDDDEPNAALFSRSDLTVTGAGTLNVTSEYMDGVVSKDDLRVKGGVLNVTAPRNGLRGKDYIEITDGVITIVAGNDGMKSTNDKDPERGYVAIGGGVITITCVDDPISVVTRLTVTGGVIEAKIVDELP